MGVDGKSLTAVAAGSLLVWSGIKGWSVLGTLGDLITGVKPTGANVAPLGGTVGGIGSAAGGAVASLSQAAQVAQGYVGHAYSFGGAPGPDGSRPWDCSSFCNFVFSVRLGMAIPGYGAGKYDGSSHGPTTIQWGAWNGIGSVSKAAVQAGDLVIWSGHMGIAVSNTQMVSALNASEGTKVTDIAGHGNGPLLRYGRYGYSGQAPS